MLTRYTRYYVNSLLPVVPLLTYLIITIPPNEVMLYENIQE